MRKLLVEKLPIPSYYDERGDAVFTDRIGKEYFPIEYSERNKKNKLKNLINTLSSDSQKLIKKNTKEIKKNIVKEFVEILKERLSKEYDMEDIELLSMIEKDLNKKLVQILGKNFDDVIVKL